jgi:tagaturonate reductase
MQLSRKNIQKITPLPDLSIPGEKLFELPEKVIQFGTGVLLRGLPDYFIDKANKQGIFNGRIVVIKSTAKGSTDAFEKQDGLFTLTVRGIEGSKTIEETIINASISRVMSATEEWNQILKCAHNPEIKLIISNTTEVGITNSDDDINQSPPPSFPGKLLALLHERYKTFNGNDDSGFVIIPTELIVDNGRKLFSIITSLSEKNKLGPGFMKWLTSANHFCSSLVDRIVPGQLPAEDRKTMQEKLGYTDELMIQAEPFRLWAIESGSEKVREILSFSKVDEGVVIVPDIEKFRELKLRLLNGTHSLSCGIALLAGFETVREAMGHEQMFGFIRRLMMSEIATAMDDKLVSYNEACAFADKVMDRFRNPFLEHKWISIAMNYTSKMRMRNIPLLQQYYARTGKAPLLIALGFAAYIVFLKCSVGEDKHYYRNINGKTFPVEDEMAGYFAKKWAGNDIDELVESVLSDKELWGADLTGLNGLAQVIKENIRLIERDGVMPVLSNGQLHKITA